MKKFLFLFLFSPVAVIAQKESSPQPFAKTITAAALKKHLYIIAGPEMEGRETATEGQRKAATYIENQFKNLRLLPTVKDGYQMYYNVYQDSLEEAALEVNGQSFKLGKDFNVSPNNISESMHLSEVISIGDDAADPLNNLNLIGKLLLLMGNNPRKLYSAVQSKGAAGILLMNNMYARYDFGRRQATINLYKETIPSQAFYISEDIAKAITGNDFDAARKNTGTKTYKANILLHVQKRLTATLQSSNVIGLLPGTDLKDQYVVISAHYDHLGKKGDSVIYYGADDDGSGTVSVLQIAEAFVKAKAAGIGPRRSIVFLANSGEEEGLWGSEYYTDHPVFPLDKTSVDLNIDMIGRTDASRKHGDSSNYVYVVGDDKLSSDLHTISEAENKNYTKLELDYKYNDPNDNQRIYYRSDHYNFAKNGVPIIFYYDGMLGADYHKPTDTPDKINYNLMAKRAQLVFNTAWNMANRNDMLKRDIPLTK